MASHRFDSVVSHEPSIIEASLVSVNKLIGFLVLTCDLLSVASFHYSLADSSGRSVT